MKVEPLDHASIDTPPRWVLQTYLGLDPPCDVTTRGLATGSMTSGQARQFATQATRHRLIVRTSRGTYGAVDPSVAIRAWALPAYYAEVLTLHDVLARRGIEHAFACLTAGAHADLVFDRPWLVVRHEDTATIPSIEAFAYDFRWSGHETIDALGGRSNVPTLSRPETALVLGATGLSREAGAAQRLLDANQPPDALVPALNYFGIATGSSIVESRDPDIGFPAFVQQRRTRLGDQLLRGERS